MPKKESAPAEQPDFAELMKKNAEIARQIRGHRVQDASQLPEDVKAKLGV